MKSSLFDSTLTAQAVQLERLTVEHLPELRAIAQDEGLWQYVRPAHQSVANYWDSYSDFIQTSNHSQSIYTYVVRDIVSKQLIGSTSFYEVDAANKRLCIGFTWYKRSVWGQGINPDVKQCLLSYVFETLGWNRVAFHVDARNERSRSAMLYLGASEEGTLRQHKIVQGDYVRDTVLFAIIKTDWPLINETLMQRLSKDL